MKCLNYLARHSPGAWHRQHLLTGGQYIKTSNPTMRHQGRGWWLVGENGPELINFQRKEDA